jgi:hypothetical protein
MGKGVFSVAMESLVTTMLNRSISSRQGTFFSQEKFIQAVARSQPEGSVRVFRIRDSNSGAYLFGLERNIPKYNRRGASFAPFSLPAYPIDADGSLACVPALVAQLKRLRTVWFDWNVRFDHGDLANQLEACRLSRSEDTTHVLHLNNPYNDLFRGFSETTRNKVRRAARQGVVVRHATNRLAVRTYYSIYRKVIADRQKWNTVYEEPLFDELFKLDDAVILLLAEVKEVVIGGAWFVRDGNSLRYWQGAMDYQYKACFPHYALMNAAIDLACNEGMHSFDMGASLQMGSLEQFKSFWGTRKVPIWSFYWKNPVWSFAAQFRRRMRWWKPATAA